MRLLVLVTIVLFLAAGVTGCASKPAAANLPPGVKENPNRLDPEAARKRKMNIVGGIPREGQPPGSSGTR
jgi:hypothetical protein